MSRFHSIRVGNRKFDSIKELADTFALPYHTVRHRIVNQGLSPKEAVEKPIQKQERKVVKAFGVTYPSISAAARAHKEDPEQVRQRVKNGMSLEDALLGKNRRKKKVKAFGVTYSSIRDAASAFDMSWSTLNGRLRQGWDIEDALLTSVQEGKKVRVDGKTYDSIAELVKAFDLPYNLVHKRITTFGWSATDAVKIPKKIGREIKIGRKKFPTIKDASEAYGVDHRVVSYRLNAGWSIERALDNAAEVDNRKSIVIDNEFFPTYSDAARAYELNETTFMKRLRVGWSPEQAAGLLPPPTVKTGKPPVTAAEYKRRLRSIHGDALDFSRAEFKRAQDDVEVICKSDRPHPSFYATPNNLLHGKGCPICKISHGAKRVARWLEEKNIDYETEWTKHGLRSKTYERAVLRFDFYLPSRRILIEYDGEQHFRPVKFGNQTEKEAIEAYKKTKTNDRRKNRWAKSSGFVLIRIRFDEKPSEVLEEQLREIIN